MQAKTGRDRRRDQEGPDDHFRKASDEVKGGVAEPLPDAELTFRTHCVGTGKARLIPMVDGIDIPHVVSMAVQHTSGEAAFLVLTVRLPHGVIVE
jgi:hypothetical protein